MQNTESTAKTLSGFQKHKYLLGLIIPGVCSNFGGFLVFCSFLLYVCGFCFIEPTYKLTYPSTAEFHGLLNLNLCMGKNRNKKLLEMFYLPVLLLGGNGNNCWLPNLGTSKESFKDFHLTPISSTHLFISVPELWSTQGCCILKVFYTLSRGMRKEERTNRSVQYA